MFNIQYLGHSCFMLDDGTTRLLFDPFVTGNPLASAIDIKTLMPHYILVSHGHGDHIADCIEIAHQSHATVISNFEVGEWLRSQGLSKLVQVNHGGELKYDFGSIKAVNAIHSSNTPDGAYGGNPMGFLIQLGGKNIYYSGDTALHMDMKLIPLWSKLDIAMLCMGNHFTMGVDDAVLASNFVECNQIIGMHYDSFPPIKIDHEAAKKKFADAGKTLHLMWVGEAMELS